MSDLPARQLVGRRIVLFFNGAAAFDHFLSLARDLRGRGGADVLFWPSGPGDARFVPRLREEGFPAVGPYRDGASAGGDGPAEAAGAPLRERSQGTARGQLRRMPGLGLGVQLVRAVRLSAKLRRKRVAARTYLADLQPSAIVTSQERPPEFITVLAEARAAGIPTVLVPPNYLCNPDGGAFMRRNDASLYVDRPLSEMAGNGGLSVWLLNRLVAALHPRQVFPSRFGGMLCYPAADIIGHRLAGLLPDNFWHQGTRFIDRLVISGDEEELVCSEAGIPPERIARLGCPLFEELAAVSAERKPRRQALCERYGLVPDRPIVIFGLPVLWEHQMVDRATQFAFLEEIFPVLARAEASLLLSLHPKSRREDYEEIAARHGAAILRDPLFEVLAAGDLFVACAYSSTVRWAMALGMPVANLDVWELNDSTYWNLKGFPTLTSVSAFERWYAVAAADPRAAPAVCRGRFGLESRPGFGDRLADLLCERIAVAG